MKYTIITDRISLVEQRVAQRWLRGTGKEAVFAEDAVGWYARFQSIPTAFYLGESEPSLKAGDTVRLTLEKVMSTPK